MTDTTTAVTARTLKRKDLGVVPDGVVKGLRWEIGKTVSTGRMSPRINGKQENVSVQTISKQASLVTIGTELKEAREKAKAIKADAKIGISPKDREEEARRAADEDKRAAKKAKQNTFAAAWDRWMVGRTNLADYKEQVRKGEDEILPVLGGILLPDLTRNDVLDYLLAKARRSQSQAINQYRLINAFLNDVLDNGDIEKNVAARLQKKLGKPVVRDRYLSLAEIFSFWTGLEKARMTPQIMLILRLLLVTLQRRNEVAHMHHDELDRKNSWWEFSAERTKGGRRHRVHLTQLAWDIIDAAGTWSGYVFAYPNGKPPAGTSVSQAMKLARPVFRIDDVTVHDLRRSGATHLGDMGAPPYVVSRILNHAVSGVTETHYLLSLYAEEKEDALGAWSDKLVEIVTGKPNLPKKNWKIADWKAKQEEDRKAAAALEAENVTRIRAAK